MDEYPIDRGVSARLAILALSSDGELRRTEFVDQAVRGALLIHLGLLGAIGIDDEVWIDTTPVGYPPADRLLAQMDAKPDQSSDHWMVKGIPSLRSMTRFLAETGILRSHRSALGGSRFELADKGWMRDGSYPSTVAKDFARRSICCRIENRQKSLEQQHGCTRQC